jgi:hypothetical protein
VDKQLGQLLQVEIPVSTSKTCASGFDTATRHITCSRESIANFKGPLGHHRFCSRSGYFGAGFPLRCADRPMLAGKFTPATVVVRLRDGSERRATAHSIPGTPEAPLSHAQIVSKARACFASGPNPLAEQRAAVLLSRIDKLELIDSMCDFWSF